MPRKAFYASESVLTLQKALARLGRRDRSTPFVFMGGRETRPDLSVPVKQEQEDDHLSRTIVRHFAPQVKRKSEIRTLKFWRALEIGWRTEGSELG